jgi:hypothetical protein
MKKVLLTILSLLLMSSLSFGTKGIVVRADVCEAGNIIIMTVDGLYIPAEYYAGVYLNPGEIVQGKLDSYGLQRISNTNGQTVKVYLGIHEAIFKDCYEKLCN